MDNQPSDQFAPDIYKAHQAIALAPSSGSRITLLMRRFFNVLLQHAQTNGLMDTYSVPLEQIFNDADFNSANFEVAKNALRGMAKTIVEWSVINEGAEDGPERRWGVSALLADAEIIQKNRRLYLEWSYSPKIRARLLDPSRYVQLSLHVYSLLKSSTAAALYEVCMRYLTNAGGLSNKAEWEWWRPRLTGIPDGDADQSREYKYFKRDTLIPAIKEINNLTDIEIELHEFKTGRKITHIQFSSKRKSADKKESQGKNKIVDDLLMARILAFGIKPDLAAKLYILRDEVSLRASLDYVENRVRKGGVESPAALFRDALKKGYAKIDATQKSQSAKNTQDHHPNTAIKPLSKLENQSLPQPSKEDGAFSPVIEFLKSITPPERERMEQEFIETIDGVVLECYRKRGLKSKVVESQFLMWAAKKYLPN
jgi:plasmid replication initiation protein